MKSANGTAAFSTRYTVSAPTPSEVGGHVEHGGTVTKPAALAGSTASASNDSYAPSTSSSTRVADAPAAAVSAPTATIPQCSLMPCLLIVASYASRARCDERTSRPARTDDVKALPVGRPGAARAAAARDDVEMKRLHGAPADTEAEGGIRHAGRLLKGRLDVDLAVADRDRRQDHRLERRERAAGNRDIDAGLRGLKRLLLRLRVACHRELERRGVHSRYAEHRHHEEQHEPDEERGAGLPRARRGGSCPEWKRLRHAAGLALRM